MKEILFESISRPLVFVHLLTAVALVGGLTHGTVFLALSEKRAKTAYLKRAAKFWKMILWTLAITMVTGLTAYPTYRIRTRAEFLDEHFPLASGLFDLKENYAAIVVVLVLACVLLRREPDDSESHSILHNWFYYLATGLTWIVALCGIWVTLHRGMA